MHRDPRPRRPSPWRYAPVPLLYRARGVASAAVWPAGSSATSAVAMSVGQAQERGLPPLPAPERWRAWGSRRGRRGCGDAILPGPRRKTALQCHPEGRPHRLAHTPLMAGPKDLTTAATRLGRGSGLDAGLARSCGRSDRAASAAGLAASAVRSFGTADDVGTTGFRSAVPQDDTRGG